MSEIGKRDRIFVFREHKILITRKVDGVIVVHIGVLARHFKFGGVGRADAVNRDQLFVQVVERSPRLVQPVLEHGHIAHIAVGQIDVFQRGNRKVDVLIVHFGG